jgi:hypothetical protein
MYNYNIKKMKPIIYLKMGYVAIILSLIVFYSTPGYAQTYGDFPYEESFLTGTRPTEISLPIPSFNAVEFTGNGLRLTPNSQGKFGAVFVNSLKFSSENGINIEFEYMIYGGNGADGICLFLFDANEQNPEVGGTGAAMGYSYNRSLLRHYPSSRKPGLKGAYLGIAFDSFGNFKTTRWLDEEIIGGIGIVSGEGSHVTLRGARGVSYPLPGMNEGYTGYPVLVTQCTKASTSNVAHVVLNENGDYDFNTPSSYTGDFHIRGGATFENGDTTNIAYRKAFIDIYPIDQQASGMYITVKIQHKNTITTIIDKYPYKNVTKYRETGIVSEISGDNIYGNITGSPTPPYSSNVLNLSSAIPEFLHIGFSAATGQGYDIHMIKNLRITLPSSAEAYNDFDTTRMNNPITINPFINDVAYQGVISENQVGSSSYINPVSFKFIPMDGSPADNNYSHQTSEGIWTFNTQTGLVTFTPVNNFEGNASIQYSIKGGLPGHTVPYDDEAYRSLPATISISVENIPSSNYEVWNWEDLWLAIEAVNAGTCDTIYLMQNIGTDDINSGNGIGTGPNGENCPHIENEKKSGKYGYDNDSYGFLPLFPGVGMGWSCPAITATSFVFEGNNNVINGLYYQGSDPNLYPALFSSVNKVEFKNLTLTTSDIGFDYAYALEYAGGFVANALNEVSFNNCLFKGHFLLTAVNQAGGFVGKAEEHVTIINSEVSDSIILTQNSTIGVGGFVGNAINGITIENSTSNMKIKAGAYAGGFAGSTNNNVTITNSTSNAIMYNITNWLPGTSVGSADSYSEDYAGGQIGGFIGAIYTDWNTTSTNGTIINGCSMNGQIISNDQSHKLNENDFKDYAGGFIGYIGHKDETSPIESNAHIIIEECSMTGAINTPESHYVGGLIGGMKSDAYMGNILISKSNVVANILAKREAGGFVGIISGKEPIYIEESYYRGNISADSSAGFAAAMQQTSGTGNYLMLIIENSYIAGSISGNNVAGFIYNAEAGLFIQNCFAAINLTPPGNSFTGKAIFLGNVSNSVNIQNVFYDKTLAKDIPEIINNGGTIIGQIQSIYTSDMTNIATYPTFWFDNSGLWAIVNEETYPFLKWQVTSDLSNAENNYSFGSTEYQLENTSVWIRFARKAPLRSAGNYIFRFKSGEGDNASEAFFPYTPQKITFSDTGNTIILNGFNVSDTVVVYGISQTGIIGIKTPSFRLLGTVFPFVHGNDDSFNDLFKVKAELYPVPASSPIEEIINSEPIYESLAENYDGNIFIPGTPKNPGDLGSQNNPGLPIDWTLTGKTQGDVDDTPLAESELPVKPIGIYVFNDVVEGEYILVLSRFGYITRFSKIIVNGDGFLGHRELIAGDVNGDFTVNAYDISAIISHIAEYGDSRYNARYDINYDEKIDFLDILLITDFYKSANIELYEDTKQWLMEY